MPKDGEMSYLQLKQAQCALVRARLDALGVEIDAPTGAGVAKTKFLSLRRAAAALAQMEADHYGVDVTTMSGGEDCDKDYA